MNKKVIHLIIIFKNFVGSFFDILLINTQFRADLEQTRENMAI